MEDIVITQSLDYAIKNYLDYKNKPDSIVFNDFFCIVIRLLCVIYDELDILNPYLNHDEKAFDKNLSKYGYEMDKILDFKVQLDAAYEEKINNLGVNQYFTMIQKTIIDMFVARKKTIGIDEVKTNEFYSLLYTPQNKNMLQIAYNFKNAKNINEVSDYFKEQMAKNIVVKADDDKKFLNPTAYQICGYSMDAVNKMSSKELNKLNSQIYRHFGIKLTTINKEYLLEMAVEKYVKEHEKITTGNGYVDILLITGMICTLAMIITIIAMVLA